MILLFISEVLTCFQRMPMNCTALVTQVTVL